jgi:hypothetical protein
MDYLTRLMQAMLKHGFRIEFRQMKAGVWFQISGPGFAGEKIVDDYPQAVGLAAYWLSETNGVKAEAKIEVREILNSRL